MEKIKKQLDASNAKYPYTSCMRNFIASSVNFTLRQTEWRKSDTCYVFGITLYERTGIEHARFARQLFHIERVGTKHLIMEECFRKLYEWLCESESDVFMVQGDEDAIELDNHEASKEENVIITGPEVETETLISKVKTQDLLEWSNTEKYYDFSGGLGAIMNRWFPLDTIKITTAMTPAKEGGLVKSWKIPEDLIKNDFDAINILPIRGFMLGKLDVEFKMVLQANPFQACCLMLSTMPNPFGVYPTVMNWTGVKNDGSHGTNLKTWPYSFESASAFTYADRDVAVQRPNCIVDVHSGGEGTLRVQQKYHKTLIRNFDSSFATDVSVGIRGAWSSNLLIHVLTQLRVGSGTDNDFNVRVFYRFVEAKLTAMTETVNKTATTLTSLPLFKLSDSETVSSASDFAQVNSYRVQGGVLGIARQVTNVADTALSLAEDIGGVGRKGFKGILNRDKPNDCVTTVRTVPRPRTCFPNGVGMDDAVVMAMGWDELVEFFEVFEDEPQSFVDFSRIKGILSVFEWAKARKAGDELWKWVVYPTVNSAATKYGMDGNLLRAPLNIASSAFTNYWGTIELCIQFVKTDFHKGSVQVSIQFGRTSSGDSLRSTYVKILNVQDCSAFKITIPYIYDTPVRYIAGTTIPMYMPSLANPHFVKFDSSTIVTVKVLNELTAPNSVTNTIDAIVWIKGGNDFCLNFPHAMNTATFVSSDLNHLLLGSSNVRRVMKSNNPDSQHAYSINAGTVVPISMKSGHDFGFVTEGNDEFEVFEVEGEEDDFNQGEFTINRITTKSHVDFSDLLKMPIKILHNFDVPAVIKRTYASEGKKEEYNLRQYCSIPVAPINYSLIDYLNHEWYTSKSMVNTSTTAFMGNTTLQQSVQNQITSMFGMYRGSLVYTLVITKSSAPIYYAYMPHDYNLRPLRAALNVEQPIFASGAYYASTREGLIGMGDDTFVDLSACATFNSMLLPQINPTERIVIPMSTQCNWLLMNRQIATEGKKSFLTTFRENQEWFNGHLMVWSAEDFTMDVYLNAGDDHKLGGFLGHHGIANPWAAFAPRDNWRTQGLDFQFKELTSSGWNSFKKITTKFVVGAACAGGAACIPTDLKPIAIGAATFCLLGGYNELQNLKGICDTMSDKVVEIDNVLQSEDLVENAARVILAVIKEAFPLMTVTNDLANKLWCASQHVVHAALATNWKNTSFAIFCVMVKLEILQMPDWKLVGDSITELVSKVLGRNEFTVQGEVEESNHWQAMCEIILTVLGAKMQVKACGGPREYLREMFQYQNYKNISGLNATMNLFRSIMRAVNRIFHWLLEKKDPNVILLKTLHKQGSDIAKFVEEAGAYLNHFNDKDMRKKNMRIKYLHVIIQAYKLKQVLLQIGNPRISQHLLGVCNDVIKKAIRQRYLFQCDIVKTEPFVLCVEGASNLGKSFSIYDLAVTGLQAINYKTNSPDCIYTIPAGVDYWNAYDDQPVIWYDDWCNIMDDETVKQHIAQLYGLKTSAAFNVPRAELDNKEQMAVPEIIMMTTNNPFPTHPIIQYPEAVYRRRDMLVKFKLADGKQNISDFSSQQLEKYEHLRVQIYSDTTKATSLSNIEMSYSEFKEIYVSRLKEFHAKELKNKNAKYKRLMTLVTEDTLDHIDIGNPFEAFERVNEEELLNTPTAEVIEREVILLKKLIEDHVELLKMRIGDEEIFHTEGLEQDPVVDQEHLFLRCAAQFRDKSDVLEEDNSFLGKIRKWYKVLKSKAMICERCGLDASSQGTAFWCEEHSHYLCFHCGTISARPYQVEKNTNNYYLDTFCCLHNSNIIVRHAGIWKNFFASLINMVVYKPIFLINMWINRNNLEEDRALLASLYCLKIVFLRIIYLGVTAKKSFQVQGDESDDEEVEIEEIDITFSDEVTSSAYDCKDLWETEMGFQEECQRLYLEFNDSFPHTSKEGIVKYICPHTLLQHEYLYTKGEFHLDFGEDKMTVLSDKICKGKCALTNQKFLNLIKKNMMINSAIYNRFKLNDIQIIVDRFPVFTRTHAIQMAIKRKSWIDLVIRRDWWENYICPAFSKGWKFIKQMFPIIASCTVIWAATKGFDRIWRWISNLMGIETQGHKYDEGKTRQSRSHRQKRHYNAFSTQSGSENFENKLNKISHNFILINLEKKRIAAWGIKNTTFLVTKHQGLQIQGSKLMKITFLNDITKGISILVSSCDFYEFEDKDLMQVTIKGVAPLFKDCTGFLPKRRDVDRNHTKGTMLIVDPKESSLFEQETRILNYTHNFTALDGSKEFTSRNVVMYDLQQKGMCGSLLCVDSNTPIVAMHIAGSETTGRGVGVPLLYEEFVVQGGFVEIADVGDDSLYYGDDCLLDYIATVPRDMIPYIPKETTIIPSLVAPMLEPPLTRPAFLAKTIDYPHEFGPLYYGVRKNGNPPLEFPINLVERAFASVRNLCLAGNVLRTPTILTVDEAVCGFPSMYVDDPYLDDSGESMYYGSMPLDTSAGFPYTTASIKKKFGIKNNSKEEWIKIVFKDSYPESCSVHDFVLENHQTNMVARQNGLMAQNIFQDCLKDERRPIEKMMKEGGTRLFSMSNIEGTIALRRYTLDLTSFLRYNRVKNGIGVGINPESLEWTILAETLLRHPNVFTTDFSNFGAGLSYMCGMKFADLILEYYAKFGVPLGSANIMVVKTLIRELMASRHIAGNLVYGTYCGSPSGAAITVEMNSFVHLMYITIVWLTISLVCKRLAGVDVLYLRDLEFSYGELEEYIIEKKIDYRQMAKEMTLDEFEENVVKIVYGDDGIFSVSDKYRDVFNAVTINLVLKVHNIGVTDASKQEKILAFGSLNDATFLKRKFVPHELLPNSLYMAQMDIKTVKECAKWIHKNPLGPEICTYENCLSAVMLSHGHGEVFYEEYRKQLNKCLEKLGLRQIELSWMELSCKYYPTLDNKIY